MRGVVIVNYNEDGNNFKCEVVYVSNIFGDVIN